MRLLLGLEFPFKSSLRLLPLLLFMDTVDLLLVGEAVNDRSGDDTVVAVEDVEFIFLTDMPRAGVGIPDNLRLGGVVIELVSIGLLLDMSKVLLAVRR